MEEGFESTNIQLGFSCFSPLTFMSLLLSRLRCGKPAFVRSSLLLLSNGFSTSLQQTPPCTIVDAYRCGKDVGRLVVLYATVDEFSYMKKKVPMELVDIKERITIGSSNGWVATLKEDGIVRLQDDLNPVASNIHPKRIPLPPLVTLPHCQTQIVTNVAMSSSSPEEEDCVVAVKFLGPQLSLCRPAQSNPEWINIRIENPCFFSSRVMFSKKDDMFCMPGSGGHLIGSWSHKQTPKFHKLRLLNLPELSKAKRELLHSCSVSEHLVESRPTGETFLVKWFRKTAAAKLGRMKTKGLMVFKLDEEGNAVYTRDIGDLCMFLSKSEPFCALANDGIYYNCVEIFDVDEVGAVLLSRSTVRSFFLPAGAPYHLPPQNYKTTFNIKSIFM